MCQASVGDSFVEKRQLDPDIAHNDICSFRAFTMEMMGAYAIKFGRSVHETEGLRQVEKQSWSGGLSGSYTAPILTRAETGELLD